jgi:hypothetical protein
MSELLKTMFGEYTGIQLLGYLWFFIIGYAIYFLTEASGRDVQSIHTPIKWSWKFWFYDNWRRYITTILCTYILFRFYIEICGHPFGNFDAVSLGLIGDGIAATVKRRVKAVSGDRDELMDDYNANELRSKQGDKADNLKSKQGDKADNLKSKQGDKADDLKSKQGDSADELKSVQKDTADDLKSIQKQTANDLKANNKEEQTT